jgi:hypothetical protein
MNFEQKIDLYLGETNNIRRKLFFPLFDLGRKLASGSTKEPLTYVVNVPRVEYAALHIAVGIIIEWSCISEDGGWEEELNTWVGKKVSFRPKGRVNPGTVWTGILVNAGNGPGSKLKFETDKYEYEIKYNEIENIKLDEGVKKTIVRSGIQQKIRKKINKVLGDEGVDNLNSKLAKIGLLGTKNRIHDEMEESVPYFPDGGCRFSEFLKPDNPDGESGRTRVYSPKEDVNSSPEEIMIIEGSRQISELLDQTKLSNRVFIIAANEIHYSEACQAINSGFRGDGKKFINNGFITVFHY